MTEGLPCGGGNLFPLDAEVRTKTRMEDPTGRQMHMRFSEETHFLRKGWSTEECTVLSSWEAADISGIQARVGWPCQCFLSSVFLH